MSLRIEFEVRAERAIVVGDAHLDPTNHVDMQRFALALREWFQRADLVLVIGDLFHYWFGRKHAHIAHLQPLRKVLADARERGRRAVFLPGNRDFLLRGRVLRELGFTWGGDHTIAEVAGTRWLLHHGDLLCADDHAYRRARFVLRSAPVRWLSHILPVFALQAVARRIRAASQRSVERRFAPGGAYALPAHLAISRERVADLLAATPGVDGGLICGHVHVAARVPLADERELITLPAWEGSEGYLELGPEGVTLVENARVTVPRPERDRPTPAGEPDPSAAFVARRSQSPG